MPRANAHFSPHDPAANSKSGRSESCTIPTDLTSDARISTTEADGRPITPAPHASGNHTNLHDDNSQLLGAERTAPSRRAVLAAFTGAALVGAVLAIPTAEAAVPESRKCRNHYETAMLLAFRKLSGEEQKGVMAFAREFGALVEQPNPAADHPDAELLALCAAYEASDAETQAYDTEAPGHSWDGLGVIQVAGWRLADQIQAIPAATPEGIRAKARAARMVWRAVNSDESSHPARHMFGLIRDFLGETVA